MGFAQSGNIFLQGVQIIADRPHIADFALAPPLGDRRRDRVFVDIQANIEFSFHSVCLLVRLHVDESERSSPLSTGIVLAALLTRATRDKMNGKHTAFFKRRPARSNRARSHKV
jgi:hypothetical protein